MKPEEFLDMLVPAAQACQRATGIPASFTLAQAALESGWGKRAPGNNVFGIKADKSWKGPTIVFSTHEEYTPGVKTLITDTFRRYPSVADCLADRTAFFRKNPRYAKCFQETTGPGWARAVARAGYATDQHYAETLIRIMDGRALTRFDLLTKKA